MKLSEESVKYVSTKVQNISDLKKVSIDVEILEDHGTNSEGEEFTYKYILVDGVKYRIPGPVFAGIKAILQKMPDCKYISVGKEGTGLQTKYFVFPYTGK